MRSKALRAVLSAGLLVALTGCADDFGQEPSKLNVARVEYRSQENPPPLGELQELTAVVDSQGNIAEFQAGIIKDVAMSLGARGGLAHRTWQINKMLDSHDAELDKVYAFQRMAIKAPSGSIVMPPIVSEASAAYNVSEDGQQATATDRVYRILKPGRIVGAPPLWRDYLVRTWKFPEPPNAALLPKTADERKLWREWVARGWIEGVKQAESIYQDDLLRLQRDIEGMARYRALVAQGIVTEMYFDQTDRGVTGGGDEMRVGDRTVRIAAPASLDAGGSASWSPVLVTAPQGVQDTMMP